MRCKVLIIFALVGCLAPWNASTASAQVTRFDLAGTVTDNTGAVMPGVTVTLRNMDTGLVRVSVTNESGRYHFPAVPPTGQWVLTGELDGFQTVRREGLTFQANTLPEMNLEMGVAGVAEAVTVTGEAPIVRTRESERSAILDATTLTELPAGDGRNFMSLLKATGEVVGEGGNISLAGQGRRTANFVADGVSMTGREVRTLDGAFGGGTGLSIETIKELQVISSGFKAETGHTGAGTVSVITKSGTNALSGTTFGYFRPTTFIGDNPITGAPPNKQDRQQYGLVLGGPLRRDKTHFFGSWESTLVDGESTVTSVLGPGTFPRPQRMHQGFGRIDHRFNDNNVFDARYSLNRNSSENGGIGGLNTFERRSNNESVSDTVVASLVSILSPTMVNEARARYSYNTTDSYSPLTASSGVESRNPDFTNVPVTVSRPGVGNAGLSPSLPQNLVEHRVQLVNHFSVTRGTHQWKFGGDAIQSWRFVTFFNNFAGTYTFTTGTPHPFDPNNPATRPFQYTQTFGDSGLNFKDTMAALFVQDDWEVTRGLTLNLGVRWDIDTLIQGDYNNVAPRVGFAWNIGNAGKTVVRGNSGIFYDTLESSLINRDSNFGPAGQRTIDIRQGDPLFPTFPNRFSEFPTGATTVPLATVTVPVFKGDRFPFSIGDTLQRTAPYFFNTTIGVQRELSPNWAASVDYVRVRGKNLFVTFDINAPPYFPLGPGQTRTVAQANALRPMGVPNRTGGPYNIGFTGFRNLFLQFNGGETHYDALKIGIQRRGGSRYEVRANYTYGSSRGDVDNFRLNESFVPGLTEIDGDRSYQWGPSSTDVPHMLTVSGYFRAPFDINIGGILVTQSGFPYTGVVGFDADGDGFSGGVFGDRPAGLSRNSFRLPSRTTLDISAAKVVRVRGSHQFELRAELFNALASKEVTNVNRTIGLDPNNPATNFGQVTSRQSPIQGQVSIRYRF
ncbi:MAG TPA: TonB-dependent receptor [Vicinamibacterales bacterium]|nr:TonB-dependent receptor [Vicinamibacterales bacterium]